MSDNLAKWASLRGTLSRGRPSFLTRTATDNAGELQRRSSLPQELVNPSNGYGTISKSGQGPPTASSSSKNTKQTSSSPRRRRRGELRDADLENGISSNDGAAEKLTNPETVEVSNKLDTFSGVFVPTSLNVLSILMFIRFGFILGQTGLLGMLGLLTAAYIINLVTTFSISAVASNGTVRGGGAYYLISRSLGPEFGGSIGIVSYIGFILNTGMNAVGLIDCLIYNFGQESGIWSNWLPENDWWPYLWSTLVVIFCVAICLAGSSLFSKAANGLLLILLLATFSIPISAMLVTPFTRPAHLRQYTRFTGIKMETLKANLFPRFTRGASGSQTKGRETWADMFGILYPATGGIYAGASMSGDLRSPSKSIPSGTLYGILLTFVSYALVIIAMSTSISRMTFYKNVNVIQDVNISETLVLLGEIATTSFSVLMGIIGPAKQLQALSRDGIFPGLGIFGQGTKKSDDPIYAILFTWLVAQITILFDINSIASLVTMSYLMMNFALHLACLLLKTSSAPNFRPSFRFFNVWTALVGAVLSIATMFFVDQSAASVSIAILVALFLVIHYTTPPKVWGSDVTSGLVYHQVRKYLLRLKTESVKYWRPQILLFVNDPRRGYKLISFANSLKKGGLFILGHVIVTENFGDSVSEAKRQRSAWTQYIDVIKIKAFINVVVSPSMEWGSRNLVLCAGLGGMRPNIVMMGFFNLEQFRKEQPLLDIPSQPPERRDAGRKRRKSEGQVKGALPTDGCYVEKRTDLQSYVLTVEDMVLKLKINVAVATGFSDLELPGQVDGDSTKKYIDLWPIQMSAEISAGDDDGKQSALTTTNFDTYTLILQLGCILNTVPSWKKTYKLRVAVFVEYESDVEEEKERVIALLENLRIKAEVLVYYLACGTIKSYNLIVNGEDVDEESEKQVEQVLEDEDWWRELQQIRGKIKNGEISAVDALSLADDTVWPPSSFTDRREPSMVRYEGLRKILRGPNRRSSFGNLSSMGVALSMRTHKLDDDLLSRHASHRSDTSDFEDSDDSQGDYNHDEDDEEYDDMLSAEDNSDSKSHTISNRSHDKVTSSRKSSHRSSKRSSRRNSGTSSLRAMPNDSLDGPSPFSHPSYIRQDSDPDGDQGQSQGQNPDFGADLESPNPRGRPFFRLRDDSLDVMADSYSSASASPSPAQPAYPDLDPDLGTLPRRKGTKSRTSSPSFSAAPIPRTRDTGQEDGIGPSIMFADEPHPKHEESHGRVKIKIQEDTQSKSNSKSAPRSIYVRGTSTDPDSSQAYGNGTSKASGTYHGSGSSLNSASGYPSAASLPLSFNDLPCRAQHLILNELISQQSEDAAVIFTTLPAPAEGTYKSEADSMSYITDLEVLTQGLGPVLMVHSNSMTVTTNL